MYLAVGLVIALLMESLRVARGRAVRRTAELGELHRQLQQRMQEQVSAEQRVRAVVDNVVDGIITITSQRIIRSFNPAAEKIFGYKAAEVIGKNVKMLMPEPDHSRHDTYVNNYLETGQAKIIGIGREVTGRRKDGSRFPLDLAVSEFQLDQTRMFVGILRDISQRKRAEETLKLLYAEVKDADHRKDEFLAMLAHELRNPLAPIRSGLDLLEMDGVDAPTAAWARNMMKQQVQHLVRLVDDLLDVSRIMRGKVQVRKEPVTLADVVNRGVETARPLITAQGHQLSVDLPAEPVWIEADPVRMTQVVANLLNNAAKYNDKPGHVWVSAEARAGTAVIRVRDDGVGIEKDLLARVFDLFTQAERSVARSQGGLGIGLTLVRSLVEMHGGSVEARSEGLGHGSEFTVRLPALAAAPAPPAAAPPRESASSEPGPQHRILVVDDNVAAAKILSEIAGRWHHDVRIAYTGESALEMAHTYLPNVILLDIGLPGISGYEVAQRLRREPQFTHVVMVAVTGYGQEEDRRRSREAGFDHHLVKPVAPEVLHDLLSVPALAN
jgi:two-component system CheB/CheR fusion protein